MSLTSGTTKNALAAAMKELMREKEFSGISIADICDRCEMNRKSFYYHFKDKYDLVNWIFQMEIIESLKFCEITSGRQLILELCRYLYQERIFYLNAMGYDGQNSFREYFTASVSSILQVFLNEQVKYKPELRFYFSIVADACLTAIRRWLSESPQTTPEEFIRNMTFLIASTID